jgi:hypothetical protein
MFGKALTVVDGNLPTITSNAKLPAPVVDGIQRFLQGFETGKTPDSADFRYMVAAYVEVAKAHEPELVLAMARSMLFDNPRNPFRPTPQDVHERCLRIKKGWRQDIERWLTGGQGSSPFEPGYDCSVEMVENIVVNLIKLRMLKWQDSSWSVDWTLMREETFARWPVELMRKHSDYEKILRVRKAEMEADARRKAGNDRLVEEHRERQEAEAKAEAEFVATPEGKALRDRQWQIGRKRQEARGRLDKRSTDPKVKRFGGRYSNEEIDAEIERHEKKLADASAAKKAALAREREEKRAKFLAEHPEWVDAGQGEAAGTDEFAPCPF